ncbi:MAG: Preprotein translocase, SecG subunit [Microgenomates group bacterium Gr01-1014_5]|nr:MAG: Preprotein translocase, SecG subunit [Microgenomates group bacterium Gr01-1014_5]
MNLFSIVQTILALILIVLIVLQGRGAGLGSAWGGEGELYGTRRGVEKILFRGTILVTFLFVAVSLASLVL